MEMYKVATIPGYFSSVVTTDKHDHAYHDRPVGMFWD